MPSEITEAEVDAALAASVDKRLSTMTNSAAMRFVLEAALAARPAPEAGSVVEPKRYLISYDARGEQQHPSGDFVHYADYRAAIAEREGRIRQKDAALLNIANEAESIRETLINHLDEPERAAFWTAVHVRSIARAALQQEGESDVTR